MGRDSEQEKALLTSELCRQDFLLVLSGLFPVHPAALQSLSLPGSASCCCCAPLGVVFVVCSCSAEGLGEALH